MKTLEASQLPDFIGPHPMSVDIVVRFTDEQAAALKAEKARAGVPVSEFIRRAVTAALTKCPHGYELVPENVWPRCPQ
jgi:hypothetical protein